MNAIRSVFAALTNLAASVNGLAAVIDGASSRLQHQLALDGAAAPILEHQPAAGGAEVETTPATKGRRKAA